MRALAKYESSTGANRTLVDHCFDVALAAQYVVYSPVMHRRLETACEHSLSAVQLARLVILAGLHDVGKACVGFQRRINGAPNGTSHLAEILAALMVDQRTQDALHAGLLTSWFSDPSAAVFASVCHHGGPVDQSSITNNLVHVPWQVAASSTYDPLLEIETLVYELLRRFPEASSVAPVIQWTTSFEHLYAGVVMLADWLGSSCPVAGPAWRPEVVQGVLDSLPWTFRHGGGPADSILPGGPIGAQQVIMQVPITDRLVITEAPTGTGKTEHALMRALTLVEAGEVDGLFFALPTRAAATEIHDRIARLTTIHSPALKGCVVRAIPGQLDTDPWQGIRSWAIASPKRALAAPVAIGTLDQAMLTVLRNRHAWLRHAALSRHLLIIDEVHASDPYMTEIVRTVVKRHLALGGHCLLMTATLGETLRAELENRPRVSLNFAREVPYPAVASASGRRGFVAPEIASTVSQAAYSLALAQATAVVRDGGCALIIRSTVDTAIQTYEELVRSGVPALLHHSRYADLDRRHLDNQLIGTIGKTGSRAPTAIVATQTAEQSLDIDADFLVTDPAPADVLLQRRGRLGRHRATLRLPMVIVAPADPDRLLRTAMQRVRKSSQRVFPGDEWLYVYDALATLATLDALRTMEEIRIPHDVRALVEAATHPDALSAYADRHACVPLFHHVWGSGLAMRQVAQGGVIDFAKPYAEQPVDDRVPTRLGGLPVTVSLASPIPAAFGGGEIDAMPIPARWLRSVRMAPTTTAMVGPSGEEWLLDVLGVRLTYGKKGLQR